MTKRFVILSAGHERIRNTLRGPTYSVDNPNGRWRKFCKEEVYARDQLKLDFKWIVSEEDDDRTLAEMIAQIKEEATSIASAVAELEKLIGEVEE